MAFETLGLPDGNVDGVDTVTDASDDTGDDHLDLLCGRGLKDGADDHDPASPCDTALAAPSIRGQEGNDCSNETAHVVDSSNDALEVPIWIVEFISERRKADDSPQDSLVITE